MHRPREPGPIRKRLTVPRRARLIRAERRQKRTASPWRSTGASRHLRLAAFGRSGSSASRRRSRPSAASALATIALASRPAARIQPLGLVLVDEEVGQRHRPHLEAAVERARSRREAEHMRAEAADRAFLDRDQHLVVAREAQDQIAVERLGEARIGDRRRQAARGELLGRLQRLGEPRAERQDRDARCLRAGCGPCRSRSGTPRSRQLDADALAARIAQRDRAVVDGPPRSPPCA